MRTINEIIIHHSATKDSGTVSWGAIRRYHIKECGWSDIGYHFGIELVSDVVASAYEILVGRSLSLAGAHTTGHNANSIGICMVGDFDAAPPPQEQLEKLRLLIRELKLIFPSIAKIAFHRDYANKTCPGKLFTKNLIGEKT
jgi:Negative regulator of beta-lactamase expression